MNATLETDALHKNSETETPENFSWELQGRVVVLDNGARFPAQKNFAQLMALNSFAVIAFDPTSHLKDNEELKDIEEFQLFPHALLGNGQPTTLYTCMSETMSGTLEPLAAEWQPKVQREGSQVLARLPISTITLDSIEGLSAIDWLLLDDMNDSIAVLEHGSQALTDTLVIQVRIPFRPTHKGQPDIAQVSHWMARQGFRFYRFQNMTHHTHIPKELDLEKIQASEMTSADALFVPTDERLATLPQERLNKLSFLLHTIYKIHDLAYAVLNRADPEKAKRYLIAQGYLWPVDENETTFTLTADYSPDIWV